jgi:hypothetical protein
MGFAGNSAAHFNGKGHVEYSKPVVQRFLNSGCQKNDSCGLTEFSVITNEIEIWFSDDEFYPALGTVMTAEYKTDSVNSLEKFVIVQFIRGCVIYSVKNFYGNIEKSVSDTLFKFFDKKSVPFCFTDWVIDSVDVDPVYNSDEDYGRHGLYRWNDVPGSFQAATQHYYGEKKPSNPRLYVTDNVLPRASYKAMGEYNLERSVDVSLEFKTCIYRTADVPKETDENNINFAVPIKCFNWKSSYVYNWELKKYESPDRLVFPD